MFYHSIEWGFDLNYINKKKRAMLFLNAHEFPTCLSKICRFDGIDEMFEKEECCYLVMVSKKKDDSKRSGYFNIVNKRQLIDSMFEDYGKEIDYNNFVYCFIGQMQETLGCFTATLFSDGKGNIVIEYLTDIVDNRFLTSGSMGERTPSCITFRDFTLIDCDSFIILEKLYGIVKKCFFLKGYFELSYAVVHGKKDVYFSYYSSDDIYMNIFNNYYDLGEKSMHNRCIFFYMIQSGMLY